MLTRPETADPAVEELKRRARRRLVGAVVLALAAAVILPLLLESDPKPLGEDVSIQIPPIDNGKFITRLPPARGADANATGSPITPAPKSAPVAQDARVEPKPAAPASAASAPASTPNAADTTEAKTADAASAPAVVAPPADTAPPAAPGNIAANPDASKAAPPVKVVSGTAAPASASPTGSLVVQVAAFEDSKAASALSSKLKGIGYPVYIDTVKTPKGSMKRVRTGPYATREIADAELGRLKAAGYRGVVTAK